QHQNKQKDWGATDSELQGLAKEAWRSEPDEERGPAVVEKATADEYDLIPFELWNRKTKTTFPVEGYQVDQHGRPHGAKGRGRKRGHLEKSMFWRRERKEGKLKFFHGYRLTIGGKRKWVTDKSLSLARFNAVKKRDGTEYL